MLKNLLSIETDRLRLIAANAALIHLELEDRPALLSAMDAAPPDEWPPPLNDDASFRFFLDIMERDPSLTGWGYWYVIEKRTGQPIGTCGFKGRPDATGTVEIGYSVVPSRQRQGFASEAVEALIAWCGTQGAKIVLAETLPELDASIRVMEKNGLVFAGQGSEPGVVRYRRALN